MEPGALWRVFWDRDTYVHVLVFHVGSFFVLLDLASRNLPLTLGIDHEMAGQNFHQIIPLGNFQQIIPPQNFHQIIPPPFHLGYTNIYEQLS